MHITIILLKNLFIILLIKTKSQYKGGYSMAPRRTKCSSSYGVLVIWKIMKQRYMVSTREFC